MNDLRYSLRGLAASPGFSAAVACTLALAIGPNTALFTMLNEVLWRSAPHIADPDRLVQLRRWSPDHDASGFSHPGYEDYRGHATVFSGLIGYRGAGVDLSVEGGRPEAVDAELVTGNYFPVLGVRAAIGRLIGPDDDRVPGGHPVAVLSEPFWKRRFGADPHLVGKIIVLNGVSYTVIGIAPPGFQGLEFGSTAAVWLPLAMERQVHPKFPTLNDRFFSSLDVVGRLKPGIGLAQAQAEMEVLAPRLEQPEDGKRCRVVLAEGTRLPPEWRQYVFGFFSVLIATAALLLMVACANIANLLLARATRRTPEIAVRLALGAGRGRLLRQLLTEGLLLSLAGAGLGLLLGLSAKALAPSLYQDWPEPLHLDGRVLGFTLAVSMLSGIIFSVAPALAAGRVNLVEDLRGGLAGRGYRSGILRSTLVVAQVAVSLVVIVVAALFVRTLRNLRAVDPGYNPNGAFYVHVSVQPRGWDDARTTRYFQELAARVAAAPGVRAACLAASVPPGFMWDNEVETGMVALQRAGKNMVGPGCVETLGVPLLAGRDIAATDTTASPRVALVNETMARRLWPNENPLGKRFRLHVPFNPPWIEVVGLLRDGRYESLGESRLPYFWLPFAQEVEAGMNVVVRAAGNLDATIRAVHGAVLEFDSSLPDPPVTTLRQHLAESLADQRLNTAGISLFGVLATLLSAIGLYGVLSYVVAQRTREIGIRMALGAGAAEVMGAVLRQGLKLGAIGVAAGLMISLAATRLLASKLYGVGSADPLSFAAAVLLLAAITLLAAWLPARRALRIDPVVALRHE